MKSSCSTYLLNAAGANDIMQAISLAAELGFAGINIDCVNNPYFSIDDFSFRKSAEIVRWALKHEIEFQCLTIAPVNPNDSKNEINRLNKAATVAHALSCPLVTFTSSGLIEKDSVFKQYDLISNIIKNSSEFADEFDICFAIEYEEKSIIDSFEKSLQLFVDVDKHNFGVVLNSVSINNNDVKQLEKNIDLIGESLLLIKIYDNEDNNVMVNILEKLRENDYSLYISDCCRSYEVEKINSDLINFIKFINSFKSNL